jgi:hypothetical protein
MSIKDLARAANRQFSLPISRLWPVLQCSSVLAAAPLIDLMSTFRNPIDASAVAIVAAANTWGALNDWIVGKVWRNQPRCIFTAR